VFASVSKGRGSIGCGASEGFNLAVLTRSADAMIASDTVDGRIMGGIDFALIRSLEIYAYGSGIEGCPPNDQFLG
jgi:hypothetical protein